MFSYKSTCIFFNFSAAPAHEAVDVPDAPAGIQKEPATMSRPGRDDLMDIQMIPATTEVGQECKYRVVSLVQRD